ncbi:MAG: hypothetical protein K2Q12_04880 [Rickettsiales bacterium]|nr:hypothetical protein [Rickettsiales bacterium]
MTRRSWRALTLCAGFSLSMLVTHSGAFAASQEAALPILLPPQVDYTKLCKPRVSLQRDTHQWNGWDGKSSPLSGRELTVLSRLYLKGSAAQPANPILAHQLALLATQKPGKHRGAALLMLAETYAQGLGTAQDSVLAKQAYEEALKISQRGAGFALGNIYEKEGEFTKAANAYTRDAAAQNPAAALALAVLLKNEKIEAARPESANEYIALAQNMLLERLAEGDCDTLAAFGLLYLRGETVQRDEATAAKWLITAASTGNTSAINALAKLYQRGAGVPADRAKVQALWEQAAALGSSEAMYNLGFSYVFGDYVKQDVLKGVPWLEKAAERYSFDAMYLLHRIYRGDYGTVANNELTMKWLHAAAMHPAAETSVMYELGRAYEAGKWVTRDFGQALDYYQQAAKSGDDKAPMRMGLMYQRGLGTPPEPRLALRFYRLAASRGNKNAMMAMYHNYQCGIAVNYDAAKTQRWLDRAVANGSFDGILTQHHILLSTHTQRDNEQAVELLQRGIDLDGRKTMLALARIYLTGIDGVPADKEKAAALLEKTISAGEDRPQGLVSLASLYISGDVLDQNSTKAIALLNEATTYKNSEAFRLLGTVYLKGKAGIPVDLSRGRAYMQQAADLDNPIAMLALANNYRIHAKDDADKEAALTWYTEAGYQGSASAAEILLEHYTQAGSAITDKKLADEWRWRLQSPESCPIAKSVTIARLYKQGQLVEKNDDVAKEWFARALRILPTITSDYKALIMAYAQGYGTLIDPAKEQEWLTRLAAMGDTASMRRLGRLNIEGRDGTKNTEDALKWYQKAADAGDEHAYLELANLYEKGVGVKKNHTLALQYLEKAAAGHSMEALRLLGDSHAHTGDYAQALAYYQQAAEMRDVGAMLRLVTLYNNSDFPQHSKEQSNQWLQKAMNAGSDTSHHMNQIGLALLNGMGVEATPELAFQWLSKAAAAGNSASMRTLSKLYMKGIGVEKDTEVATQWLQKAADAGNIGAMVDLADAYVVGTGVAQDKKRARELYLAAAEKGSFKAMRETGLLFLRGAKAQRNEKEGIRWLTEAAEGGDVHAMEELGRSYAAGFGVEESPKKALYWWKLAANAGSRDAKKQLKSAVSSGYLSANDVED